MAAYCDWQKQPFQVMVHTVLKKYVLLTDRKHGADSEILVVGYDSLDARSAESEFRIS